MTIGLLGACTSQNKTTHTPVPMGPPVPPANSQIDSLKKYELKLQALGDSILHGPIQLDRINATTAFIPLFVKTLKFRGSFDYPFDSLKFLKKLTPPDGRFRIYNWALAYDDGTFRFYGAIQYPGDSLSLVALRDYRQKLDPDTLEQITVGPDQWVGALYYNIAETMVKKTPYYTLIGWDGHNHVSDHKVIEVLWFDEKNRPRFGAPIIKDSDTLKRRKIYEFSGETTMLLNYLPDLGVITNDHLVPPSPNAIGRFWLYVPDGSYDYWEWKKGYWVFREDLFETIHKNIPAAGE